MCLNLSGFRNYRKLFVLCARKFCVQNQENEIDLDNEYEDASDDNIETNNNDASKERQEDGDDDANDSGSSSEEQEGGLLGLILNLSGVNAISN